MAIDQRDISSTLRFMDDRALQQYAAMHKSDPYIFPLAFQESQNRQKLRMSQQGAQGMQPQPKVADQALAQMAPQQPRPMAQPMPEAQGIGALPAGNMEGMADGGIAGYEGYDESGVSSNFGQGPVVMMAEGGVARYAGEGPSLVESIDPLTGTFYMPGYFDPVAGDPESMRRVRSSPYVPEQLPAEQAALLRRFPKPAKPGAVSDAAPKADTKASAGPRREATPKGSTDQFDVESMMNTALTKAEAKPNPMEAQLKAINDAKIKAAEENVTGLDAIQKQFGDIYKGRKERLDTREGEIAKMKDQSLGLALLNAGARIMQTRGSIGQAIGAGIDTGSKQYVAGLDKINAAKDKLSDARDRLEEIESQRGELSARELHKARNEVKSITTAGMENLVQAAMAERKMNRTEAIAFVNAQLQTNLKLYEVGQRSKDTQALIAARGDTSGVKQNQVAINALKAQATNISNQLKDIVAIPSNAAKRQPLEAQLARINGQLAQLSGLGTMMPASPAGASSGVQFLGYE